ncbi:MAG: Poly-gamma-glutamate synthase PgsB [Devosia sp.]|nr:Poly-gamma-glutamate synthase PgsB [Devosia sp.]
MALPYINATTLSLALLLSTLGVVSILAVAAHLHRQNRDAIGIRIHVAGSRGKTSTTRLLGSALREAGIKTLVKTTGTDPLLILPDGTVRTWRRWAPPSISEQARFFCLARQLRVEAVVLESMAIEPEYMWASEHYLVKATHTLITNARPDHAEALGSDPEAAARALALIVPAQTKLYFSSEAALPPIVKAAEALRTRGGKATTIDTEGMPHNDTNCALALAVCDDLRISPAIAELGFQRAGEDPGAFAIIPLQVDNHTIRFVNAFACNDPVSFAHLWREHHRGENAVVLINTRSDRPERTKAFLDSLTELRPPVRRVVLVGAVPNRWLKAGADAGVAMSRIPTSNVHKLLPILAEAAGHNGAVWGVGNYAGLGKKLIDLAKHRAI